MAPSPFAAATLGRKHNTDFFSSISHNQSWLFSKNNHQKHVLSRKDNLMTIHCLAPPPSHTHTPAARYSRYLIAIQWIGSADTTFSCSTSLLPANLSPHSIFMYNISPSSFGSIGLVVVTTMPFLFIKCQTIKIDSQKKNNSLALSKCIRGKY